MDFISRLSQALLAEVKTGPTLKELKSKYPNFTQFYGDLYIFSERLANNKSHHDRKNSTWGLYDIKTNQIILPPKYIFLTFGKEKKTLPSFMDGGDIFPGKKIIKVRESLGDEEDKVIGKYKIHGNENYYDLDARKFLFPDKYQGIQANGEFDNSQFKNYSNIQPLFLVKQNKKLSIIDKNDHVIYAFNEEWLGDISIIEHAGNLFAFTGRYDWAEQTSITNLTQKKVVLAPGEFNSIKLHPEHSTAKFLVHKNQMWVTAEKTGEGKTLINIDTGERKKLEKGSDKLFSNSKGIYALTDKYSESGARIVNIFSSNESYKLPPPYDDCEDIKLWSGALFAFVSHVGGDFERSLISLKNNGVSFVGINLGWDFKMMDDAYQEVTFIFEQWK